MGLAKTIKDKAKNVNEWRKEYSKTIKESDWKKKVLHFYKCSSGHHNWKILYVTTKDARVGTMTVALECKDCGETTITFHDLTEEEVIEFRNPTVERLLIEAGYIELVNEELVVDLQFGDKGGVYYPPKRENKKHEP